MKVFSHTYKVTIFESGKFCWKNKGWVEKTKDDLINDKAFDFSINILLLTILFLAV